MKITRNKVMDGLLLLVLILFLFTPVGFHIKVQVNKWFSFSPEPLAQKDQKSLRAYDWQLFDMDGKRFNLEETRGKVVVVNFWATWCPPCVAEMPSFQQLYEAYGSNVQFVFYANDELERVQSFMVKKKYSFPVYIAGTEVPAELEHPSIPTTYIIDTQGNIVLKEVGAADWDSRAVFDLLDRLLSKQGV